MESCFGMWISSDIHDMNDNKLLQTCTDLATSSYCRSFETWGLGLSDQCHHVRLWLSLIVYHDSELLTMGV